MTIRSFLSALLSLIVFPAHAELPNGTREIVLHSNGGESIGVATVTFTAEGNTAKYEIDWDDTKFADYFLSMRPFKCLESREKLWCRIPYPYDIKRELTEGDLVDLEYDLMFVWKNANDYGIDLWNGVYYRLSEDGDTLIGTMNDLDMNVLASPPENGNVRPVSTGDLEEADPDSHWLPSLTIK